MALSTAFGSGFRSGVGSVATLEGLRQKDQQLQQEKTQQLIENYNSNVEKRITELSKARENLMTRKADGEEVNMDAFRKLVETNKNKSIRVGTELSGAGLPVDTDLVGQQFDNLLTMPSPEQRARVEGQTEATKKAAVAEATGDVEPYYDPRIGKTVGVKKWDQQAIDEIVAAGGFPTSGVIETDDPSKLSPASQLKADTAASDALGSVQSGAEAIKALTDVPGAAGLPGKITETVGGFLGGIGFEDAENAVSNFFSGADAEEVKAARSKFVTFQGEMARSILNDTRISDYERRILNEALGATGPTASPQQLIGSYKKTLAAATTLARRKKVLAGETPLDLDSDEDINKLGQQLVEAGLSNEDAVDVIKRIKKIEAINEL